MKTLQMFGVLLALALTARAQEAAAPQAVTALEDLEALTIAADSASGTWNSGTYAYDAAGNISAIGTQYFLYDTLGRLKTAKINVDRTGASSTTEAYTYDEYGNLRQMAREGWAARNISVNPATNRVTDTGSVYDAAGNLVEWRSGLVVNKMTFDAVGMPAKLEAGAAPPRLYIYTADDERLWTFDTGTVNQSHWTIRDLDGKVLRDYFDNGTWSIARDYFYREDQMLASTSPNSEVHYSLDHLGTPRLLTGPTREQIAFQTFLPFGEEVSQSILANGVKKFTGHERDTDPAGQGEALDYMHARFYNGRAGRFLSVDPILGVPERPQSWNRYAYVENRAVNADDPDGLQIVIRAPDPGVSDFQIFVFQSFMRWGAQQLWLGLRRLDRAHHSLVLQTGQAVNTMRRDDAKCATDDECFDDLLVLGIVGGGGGGQKMTAKAASRIGKAAAKAGGRAGSMGLRRLAEDLGFKVVSGGEHLKVVDSAGNLVTTIPNTLHGTGTGLKIVKDMVKRAGLE